MPSTDLPPAFHVAEPRAFGHFIGDRVARHIEVTVPLPYVLADDRLPKRARVSKWMELDDVAVRAARSANATRYRIDLNYQIVDSPTQPQVAAIPSVRLRFVGGGRAFEQDIGAWPLAIAPLAPGGTQAGLEALRPARGPAQIDDTASWVRLALFGAGSAILFAYLALVQVALRLAARRGPFAAAHRTLGLLAASAPSAARHQAALRAVHRAFDQTADFRVFAERLEEFFALRPEFLVAREPAREFFDLSRQAFFGPPGGVAASAPLDRLLALTAQFKACERRARGHANGARQPEHRVRERASHGQTGARPLLHDDTL